jgi:ABC-type dipeptide/oligopeptide/nickel transport system ATPase component
VRHERAMTPLLEVRDLRVSFETASGLVRAVDGVSFSIDAGESVALVGESGCGKTVTALALMRLIEPPGRIDPESVIRFGGANVLTLAPDALRAMRGAHLGMMFADSLAAFDPMLTIGEQIADAILAHEGVSRTAAGERAVNMLARTGLPGPGDITHRYAHELSGGQRQRAALAMALAVRPALLIADEPTSALDVTTQAQIIDLLDALRAESGTALLLITHDFGVAAAATSRALVMHAGQIVEDAPTASIIDGPSHPFTKSLVDAWPRLR